MEKKISVSKIPGSLNLKFTFQFDHSSMMRKVCEFGTTAVKKILRAVQLHNNSKNECL